ncbi:MAG: PhoH family protein, partial [Fimbriiglobus sp.]|nr:PhoH family protein [Fimbriiglobus sp.]
MADSQFPISRVLTLDSREEGLALCGPRDQFAHLVRDGFGVRVLTRGGDVLTIAGKTEDAVDKADRTFTQLRQIHRKHGKVTAEDVRSVIEVVKGHEQTAIAPTVDGGRYMRPRTDGQGRYVQAMKSHDVVLCVGPAGTGKTYLAVGWAVSLLKSGAVKKIVLVRPAVEAGERLGFLPGDLKEKINPYLRPLFDSLADLLDPATVERYIESEVIEICPLAFMRGRTLNQACMILDEGQNATVPQMKMFLTRMGFNSKIIVTGDMTQVDLPRTVRNGLADAVARLKDIDGISVVHLGDGDIVRNPLVQKIVNAYDDDTPRA